MTGSEILALSQKALKTLPNVVDFGRQEESKKKSSYYVSFSNGYAATLSPDKGNKKWDYSVIKCVTVGSLKNAETCFHVKIDDEDNFFCEKTVLASLQDIQEL